MDEHASDSDCLLSIIKVEPEEFQVNDQNDHLSADDNLHSKANTCVSQRQTPEFQ